VTGWYGGHAVLLQQTAIYALVALSFQVVLRSGVFSFASVGFFGLGGYLAADLAKHGLSLVPIVLIVCLSTWVVSYGLGMVFGRLRGLYLGMVTFAFDEIIVVVGNNGGGLTGGPVGLYAVPELLTTTEILVIAAAACLLVSQLERGALGRATAILRVDERLGRSQGFAVDRQRYFLFALSATLGGLAGAAQVLTTSTFGTTEFGFSLIVLGLTMAVVGGVVSWVGAAVGAIVVTWFPEIVAPFAAYQDIIYSALVVLVVVYEPNGLVGLARQLPRAIHRWRATRGQSEAPLASTEVTGIPTSAPTDPRVEQWTPS
jgi:branched-chain amino acid transport system permease protein